MKKIVNNGFTNKEKYLENDNFIIIKNNNGLNHLLNYNLLKRFDFVPKLISVDSKSVVWKYHESSHLTKPTVEDLQQLGLIIREVHKSDIKLPKNNLRKRIHTYLKIYYAKEKRDDLIEKHYKYISKLISKMGKINPCHNDLWQENILKSTNDKIFIVDWEYATMGDKHFDLAYLIENFQLDKHQEKIFLDAYSSQDDYYAYIDEWLLPYKFFVNWLTILWCYAQKEMPFDIREIRIRLAYLSKKI